MDSLPSAIGRYEVKAFIARGGMGTLYLARDPVLHRQVAIKLLREADNDELRTRFTREARSAANLRHRNIVTIFDVGDYNNQPFMAMEYIQGQTLGALIAGDPPPSIIRRLELVEELCDGLAYAHRQGVVHRDVKPANLMVDAEGTLKILDFGIARAAAESGMTQAGLLVGTLNYMSPEQVAGTPIDGRSDMFAVGAVMYELLTRRQAFPGAIDSGVLNRILSGEPEPIEALFPHLDPAIADIVRTALQKRPGDRYADLQQMRAEVQQARRSLEDSVQQPDLDHTLLSLPDQTTRATPTPSRRGTDRDEIARRRAQQIEAHIAAAKQALEEARYDEAIKYCEDVLLIDPNESRALDMSDRARLKRDEAAARDWVSQARQHLKAGDLTSASNCVKEALALIPNSSEALEMSRLIGEARLAAERERQRAAAIEDALARGRAALGRGEPEAAIAASAEALALAPGHDDARRLREEAQQAIETRERQARDAEAQETVDEARRLFAEEQYEDALGVLEQFWPAHPKVSHAWTELTAERTRIEAEREARTVFNAPPTISNVPPVGSREDDRTVFVPRGPTSEPPPAQTPPPIVDRTIAATPPVVDRTIAAPTPPQPTPAAPTPTPRPSPASVERKDSPAGVRAEPVTREPAAAASGKKPVEPLPPPERSRAALYGGLAALILIGLFVWLMFGGGGKDGGVVANNTPTTTLVRPSTTLPSTTTLPATTTTTTSPAATSTTSTTTLARRATTTTTTQPAVVIPPTTLPIRPSTTLAVATTTTTTTTLPPTTTTSTTNAPTTTLPRVIAPQVNEREAIERMLNQYAAAFGRKDIATISRLHPSIGEAALNAIRRSKSFTVDISDIQASVAPNATTATATAVVRTENRPEAGATQRLTESTQFLVEKRGGSWIITSRRKQ